MSINNLPASIATAIQQGYLEREFREPLVAKLAYRSVADVEPFMGNVGESTTRTRRGLFPAVTTPTAPAANSDLDNGMTAQYFTTEQYIVSLNQYNFTTDLNLRTSKVAIADIFLQNARNLAEGAARSVESLARNALFNTQLGGNTFVTTTLGSAGTTVHVDDIRGFQNTWNNVNQVFPVSSSHTLSVTFTAPGSSTANTTSTNTVGGTYSLTGVTPDATTALNSAGTGPASGNTSKMWATGGISGTLTFSSNVTVGDGTAGNTVQMAMSPVVVRPFNRAGSNMLIAGDTLNSQLILQAKSTMQANGVEPFEDGYYRFIADPFQLNALYNDTAFQRFQMGHTGSQEYLQGVVGEIMGVQVVQTPMAPIASAAATGTIDIHTGMLIGKGALVESGFTNEAYTSQLTADDQELITIVDGIAHVTREPLDRLKQVIAQSWTYFGGFVSPTDITTNTGTIPTANNSAWKRAVAIQTAAA